MKGQISIDYYVSIAVFIFFIVYFLFQISNIVPTFKGQMEEQRMRLEAYQISEVLANDGGKPLQWAWQPIGNIERIGLSDHMANKTNLLNVSKIAALDELCESQGQQFLKTRMGTDLDFSVFVIDRRNNTVMLDCLPPDTNATTGAPLLRGTSITAARMVAFNNNDFGEIKVQVWRPVR